MAKAKFYAIKGADGGKVVTSWPECEKLTHGVKGALFKAFGTREEADAWVAGVTAKCPEGGLRVFVDGSFSPDYARAGWAFVAVEDGTEIASERGVTAFPAESRNIDGELLAAYRAMRWLKMNGKEGIICHDYEGVARWAKGEWKAKSHVAQRYIEAISELAKGVRFEKVEAHTGVRWNEEVDKRAKLAITEAKAKEKGASAPA
ncbi:MAG: ribonuclease H family protein [Sphaerochaetaceae bacterium]